MRRVLWYLSWVTNPGARLVIFAWALACLALGLALSYRSPLEVWTGWGFLLAGVALVASFPRIEMHLAFAGFGVACSAAAARCFQSLFVADAWHGAIIIFIAWGGLAIGLLQRAVASLEVILIERGLDQ